MRQHQIICVRGGGPVQWAVVAVDPGGSRDWLSFYPTEAEAQAEADRLGEAERQSERMMHPELADVRRDRSR